MKIEEYISELLYDHDCVIVPDFGGFVCNYAPARIDPVKHLFEPPGKKILFNKGLTRNDGLLAHHISGKLKLPYPRVLETIEQEVKKYREELSKDKRITLENVGLLYLDEKENLLFNQDYKINYLPESYGLSAFYRLPALQATAGNEAVVIPIHKERKRVRLYAAAAVITVLVASAFWFSLMEKQTNIRFSSLNIFSGKKEVPEYVFSSAKYKPIPKPVAEDFHLTVITRDAIPSPSVAANIPVSNKPVSVITSSYFSIVVGSFAEKEHAENLINKFSKENVHLSIIGRNPQGLYMVGYGKYLSHNDAVAQRESFVKIYNTDAWVKAN